MNKYTGLSVCHLRNELDAYQPHFVLAVFVFSQLCEGIFEVIALAV